MTRVRVQLALAKGPDTAFLYKLHAFVSAVLWLCRPRGYLSETKIACHWDRVRPIWLVPCYLTLQ